MKPMDLPKQLGQIAKKLRRAGIQATLRPIKSRPRGVGDGFEIPSTFQPGDRGRVPGDPGGTRPW